MGKRNSHCSYCGAAFSGEPPWPRTCASCAAVSYVNPTPVAVLVLPVDGDGVVTVRRAIEPRKGQLALPGGYINLGESWQHAAARELLEETGLVVDAAKIEHVRTVSAPDSTLLVFGVAPMIALGDLAAFKPSDETSDIVVVRSAVELAFSLHTEVLATHYAKRTV